MRPGLAVADHESIFVRHAIGGHVIDLGEIRMNYTTLGDPARPALLLISAQTDSWWGSEAVMRILTARFRMFAVDLRGQWRATWTPGGPAAP